MTSTIYSLEMVQTRSENVKTPAFFSVGCKTRTSFKEFVKLLSSLYDVELSIPGPGSLSCRTLKEFCGGLLEGDRNHSWHRIIADSHLSSDSRRSIAMSLFLFRKCIPSPEPSIDLYVEKMSKPSPLPDGDFLLFVQREVRRMFPPGWDREYYPNAALNSTLPIKSCVQRSLGKGGCRKEVLTRTDAWNSHQSFVLRVLSEESRSSLLPSRVRPVLTGGKWRTISVGDVEMNVLRPLNTAIYNRISQFDWLLRGEADACKFKKFMSREGEIFVSGDYESATDNLNMFVQKVLLENILRGSRWVPDHIKEFARESQQPFIVGSDNRPVQIQTGQLMGNLLSFPLLCLVNYLAFRFYTGNDHSIPVKVNGDDIVFRSSSEVANRWMMGVKGSGLTLSVGKTLVDPRYFTLNSKMFKSGKTMPRLIPVIRPSSFGWGLKPMEVHSIGGCWQRIKRDFPCGFDRRLLVEEAFLRRNIRVIVASRRSLTRGHDILFNALSLTRTNLWKREVFYLSLEKEVPLPVPASVLHQKRIPDDWELRRVEKMTKEIKDLSRGVASAFIQCAWSPPRDLTKEEELAEERALLNQGPFYTPHGRLSLTKKGKLLGLSTTNSKRFLKPGLFRCSEQGWKWETRPSEILRISRPLGKKVWLPAGNSSKINVEEQEWYGAVHTRTVSYLSSDGVLIDMSVNRELFPPPPYSLEDKKRAPPPVEQLVAPCRDDVAIQRWCRRCGGRYLLSLSTCKCTK